MDPVVSFAAKRKIKILIVLFAALAVLAAAFLLRRPDFNRLLDADTLYIYQNNTLIASVDHPSHMMDTYHSSVAVYQTDPSRLGLRRAEMPELYRLDFAENGKSIMQIKILSPKTQQAIDKIAKSDAQNEWIEFNGYYIVLNTRFQYFLFGTHFFENLSGILMENQTWLGST